MGGWGAGGGRAAGALLLVGGSQFLVGLLVAEVVYPGYSVSENYISDLGVWGRPSAPVFNVSVVLVGVASLLAAYFLQREFRVWPLSVCYGLVGLGSVGVGFFPENTVMVNGVPVVHAIAALTSFLFGGITPIYSIRITSGIFRYFSAALGSAALLALALFFATAPGYLGIGVGGMERMIVYPTLIWTISMGANLLPKPNKK